MKRLVWIVDVVDCAMAGRRARRMLVTARVLAAIPRRERVEGATVVGIFGFLVCGPALDTLGGRFGRRSAGGGGRRTRINRSDLRSAALLWHVAESRRQQAEDRVECRSGIWLSLEAPAHQVRDFWRRSVWGLEFLRPSDDAVGDLFIRGPEVRELATAEKFEQCDGETPHVRL